MGRGVRVYAANLIEIALSPGDYVDARNHNGAVLFLDHCVFCQLRGQMVNFVGQALAVFVRGYGIADCAGSTGQLDVKAGVETMIAVGTQKRHLANVREPGNK